MVREKETFSKDSFSPTRVLSKNAPRCRTPSSAVAGGATACPAAAAEAGTAEEKESVARLRPAGAPAFPQLMRCSSSPRHIRADRLASRLQHRRTAAWKASENCPVPARHGESFQAAAGLNTGSGRPPSRPPSFFGLCPLPPSSRLRPLPCAGLFPPPSRPLRSVAPALTFPSWDGPPFLSSPGSGLPLSVRHGPHAIPFRLRQPVSSPPLHRRPGRHVAPSFFCSGRREGNISVVPDGKLLYSLLLSICWIFILQKVLPFPREIRRAATTKAENFSTLM